MPSLAPLPAFHPTCDEAAGLDRAEPAHGPSAVAASTLSSSGLGTPPTLGLQLGCGISTTGPGSYGARDSPWVTGVTHRPGHAPGEVGAVEPAGAHSSTGWPSTRGHSCLLRKAINAGHLRSPRICETQVSCGSVGTEMPTRSLCGYKTQG